MYGLRAELLATARLASMSGPESSSAAEAARTALWRLSLVSHCAAGYRAAYGPHLLGADSPLDPGELALLAGWYPVLPETDEAELAALVDQFASREEFLTQVDTSSVAQAANKWCHALTSSALPTTRETH